MSKHWKQKEYDESKVSSVMVQTGLPPQMAALLVERGIHDPEAVDKYMFPDLHTLTSPYDLPDMEVACKKIWECIDNGLPIVVYGDYDVDGITSSSLMKRFFDGLKANANVFIPSRTKHGYGFSNAGLEDAITEFNPSLIITVDCGVNSKETVANAMSKGINVIVTDHHEPDAGKAEPLALINPKCGEARHLDILAGVGVAFKLCQGIQEFGSKLGREAALVMDIAEYMDIAAFGTVADIVPLIGENRIIVKHGLVSMEKTRWCGLRSLMRICGIHGAIEPHHIGFKMGPRINAAGRMGSAMDALKLMTTNDQGEAIRFASELDDINVDRKSAMEVIIKDVDEIVESTFNPEADFAIVVAKEGWNAGIVGIVASRIVEKYNRPTILMAINGNNVGGSARSIEGFNLLQGMTHCAPLLDKFGGHKVAAGCGLHVDNLPAFKKEFNEYATAMLKGKDLTPTILFDGIVDIADINWDFHDAQQRMAPFGQSNPEPIWCLKNVVLNSYKRIAEKHLKLTFYSPGFEPVDAIIFGFTELDLPEMDNNRCDVLFRLKTNSFRGETTLQLMMLDIKAATG